MLMCCSQHDRLANRLRLIVLSLSHQVFRHTLSDPARKVTTEANLTSRKATHIRQHCLLHKSVLEGRVHGRYRTDFRALMHP